MNAFLAYHDSLTELPNRRMFERFLTQTLEKSKSSGQSFALVYLDMDRFKSINDSLGHAVGDQLLISIAKRLQEQIRETDLVARMGGDEFTVILPSIRDLNCATEVAKRIIEKFQEPFIIEQYELFITTSAGISIHPNDGEDSSTLMKNADSALYRAKELGKNNYQIYTASMNIQTYKLFNEWGLVPPDEFLPISEETGLIIPLGQWVKQTVCQQNKKWQQSGLRPIPILINVSAKEFLSRVIIHDIQQALSDSELDPQYLEIEITEGSLLENADSVMTILHILSKLGIKISLDDFGTGYSSLSYLKRFKRTINILKIDKSFIQDLHRDNDDNVIIQTIIQLAQHMNMSVVAEGVETAEQLHILKRLKCDLVQGYLFSKPIPAAQFASLLEKGTLVPLMNENEQEQYPYENKRSYFRVDLHFPLLASMTVIEINEKNIELGKTDIKSHAQ
ncbi:polar amino acid transport system substrate-binding protein [Paenibacillus taihuensis]|uniref:Polar amino acid transport system substrate-binding protein n=1 Tax=Paenibacillus taihuensis TaxID=1156355 RepID=A0A3D9SMN5_9BACL|nr:EAL domain-containing protein [Paenibacillus taihuensis]REE93165.1 polar amino acid transport system substrate-binding protein [Paenibacillus taihuensis]